MYYVCKKKLKVLTNICKKRAPGAKNNEFLEEALVFDHHYGTSTSFVKTNLALKKNIILEIDWQGARSIERAGLKNTSIFMDI